MEEEREEQEEQEEEHLVHRMTFCPLGVREMFLAQTGKSGGGPGRGGRGAEEVEVGGSCASFSVLILFSSFIFSSSSSSSSSLTWKETCHEVTA